jgi:hypothetical protein
MWGIQEIRINQVKHQYMNCSKTNLNLKETWLGLQSSLNKINNYN